MSAAAPFRSKKRRASYVEYGYGPASKLPPPSLPRHVSTVGMASSTRAPRTARASLNQRTGGLIGLEYKYVDQDLSDASITGTWTGGEIDPAAANCIGACVQGSGESQRDGSRIVVKSIQVSGFVYRDQLSDQADARPGQLVQISLVMDKQSNGVQLNAEDVFSTAGPDVPGRRVVANSSRFKVLKTWLISLHDTSAGTDGANTQTLGGMTVPFSCYLKLNQVVNFVAGAGAGTVADMKDVSFHLIAAADGVVASDYISYSTRIRFIG